MQKLAYQKHNLSNITGYEWNKKLAGLIYLT